MVKKARESAKRPLETLVQIRMSMALKEKIEAWAAEEEETMSGIIRRLIRDGVAAHEREEER